MPNSNPLSPNAIEEAFRPLRDALRPAGTADVTLLRLKPGCAVNADIPQRAIDEIIKYHTMGKSLGEPEPACMALAKILLTDSAYLEFDKGPRSNTVSL